MKQYCLESSPLIYTPNVLRYFRRMYECAPKGKDGARDRAQARMAMTLGYPGLPKAVALDYLSGEIDFVLEDECAILTEKEVHEHAC
jgi:hypothetical protein